MDEIVNKFLLAGDKSKPEMRLRQPGMESLMASNFFTDKYLS